MPWAIDHLDVSREPAVIGVHEAAPEGHGDRVVTVLGANTDDPADRLAQVAVSVGAAYLAGARVIRTDDPGAARRTIAVLAALTAARRSASGTA